MENNRTFGQWLKSQRRIADLTQQALADRVNCSVETIYKIEADHRRPSEQIARLIAAVFGVTGPELHAFVRFARSGQPLSNRSFEASAPWRSEFIPPHNLPRQLTSFVGREKEMSDVVTLLRREDVQMVTLLGPPGIGKTRLSIEVGQRALLDFPDGVFMVELAQITQPDRVVPQIARTLDIALTGHKKAQDSLHRYLYSRRTLLILDNFEQIEDGALIIHALLVACPLVHVIVTSRSPLRIRGEHRYPLRPLDLPARANDLAPAHLGGYSAIALFVERAQAAQPEFTLNAQNGTEIAALCARLDGLPLAIEIVAVQAMALAPRDILERWSPVAVLHSPGMVDSDPRHQSLNNAIRWSYERLDGVDQALLRQMGFFVDGWTLDAAQGIAEYPRDIAFATANLVAMNLVARAGANTESARYRLLEIVRQFAQLEMSAHGESERTRNRHADYYLDYAQHHEHAVWRDGQVDGLARFEAEHGNLHAALDRFIQSQSWSQALTLAGALIHYWVYRNHLVTGLAYVGEVLRAPAGDPDLLAGRARMLNGAAILSYFAGDYPSIGAYAGDALRTAELANSPREIAFACTSLGMMSGGMGRFAEANTYFEQGMAAAQSVDIPWEESSLLNGLGEVARSQGQYDTAMRYFERALSISSGIGNLWLDAHVLDNMGHACLATGDLDSALDYVRRSLNASAALDDERGVAMCIEKLAGIALHRGDRLRAVYLLGAADGLRAAKNAPVEGMDAQDHAALLAELKAVVPPDAFARSWDDGRGTPLSGILDAANAF